MMPPKEEREHARAEYLRLLGDRRPVTEDGPLFIAAWRCVDVALRVSDHVADTFGLPRFDRRLALPRAGETATTWIDRVALALQMVGEVEQGEERRVERHPRERRSVVQ